MDKKFDEYNFSKPDLFTKNYDSCKYHDNLMHLCISAFTSEGKCFELGYSFYSSEPLLELGIKNFDIFIINQSTNYAIFVECRTSISKGDVSDRYDAIEEIKSKREYLESKIGNKIHHIEYVFCIPSDNLSTLIKQLDNVEKNKKINPKKDPVFFIWHINKFERRKTLQIFVRKNPFPLIHKDKNLTDLLDKGVPVRSYYSPDIYPSSHPCWQGRNLISKIIAENDRIIKNKNIDDEDADEFRKTFSKNFVYDYFNNERTLTHYDRKTIANQLTERFLRESLEYNIIEEIGKEKYRLTIREKGKDTILNNYEKKYKENILKKHAEEKAYEEYFSKNKQLPI